MKQKMALFRSDQNELAVISPQFGLCEVAALVRPVMIGGNLSQQASFERSP